MLLAVTAKPNSQNGKGKKGKGKNSEKSNGNTQIGGGNNVGGKGGCDKENPSGGKGDVRPSLEDLIASIKKKNDSRRK